jgi:hypothetical protein
MFCCLGISSPRSQSTTPIPTSRKSSCKSSQRISAILTERSNWGDWILKETGAYGFRFDAVKHISQEFIADFVKHIRSSESGRPKAFCVGEFWKGTSH